MSFVHGHGLGSVAQVTLDQVRLGTAVLKRGVFDSPAVSYLQTLLRTVAVDGDFGSETETAVKAAQARAGLATTGIVDALTLATIEGKPATTTVRGASALTPAQRKAATSAAKAKIKALRGPAAAAALPALPAWMPKGKTLAIAGGGLVALLALGLVLKRRGRA